MELAVTKLHYGGQEFRVDEAEAKEFERKVRECLQAADEFISFQDVKLANGGTVNVAVSRYIPIAIEHSNPNPPKAVFG
jgi:hypothetical protein